MMLPTRWVKIIKDIWSNPSRSLLVIASIAVGIAAVGMINNAGRIIQRDLYSQYAAGNPARLNIYISGFPKELAKSVAGMREVADAQAVRTLSASLIHSDEKKSDINMNVLADYQDVRINRYNVDEGAAVPGIREILIERISARKLGLKVGDQVIVEIDNQRQYKLTVSGIIHNVYILPMTIFNEAFGYISMETLEWMGEMPYYNRLDIVTAANPGDKDHVLNVGALARDRVIEPAGYQVSGIAIPGIGSSPGDHWAHDQIVGFVLILQIMGVLAVFLSCGIVINTVSALIVQQIKQIGILRSVGAVRSQVAGMYMANVLIFSVLGLIIALPLGLAGATWLSYFAANFLNFDVTIIDLPPSVAFLQIAIGLIMPTCAAAFPILSGTRIPVYNAIYQYGLGTRNKVGWFEKLLSKIRSINPPLTLSLRNTFRKKSRLIFTLVTLTLAGAMFIASFSTRDSLNAQIKQIEHYTVFDASLSIPGGANRSTVLREAMRIPGVTLAEGWSEAVGVFVDASNNESEEFVIVGLPYNSRTIDPVMQQGTWLQGAGLPQIVVNADLVQAKPDIKIGSKVTLKVGDHKRLFEVVGITSKHLYGSRIYMDSDSFTRLTGRQNQVDVVRVIAQPGKPGTPAVQEAIAQQLQERFKNAGLSTAIASTQHNFFKNFTDIFNIILMILMIMAGILAVVGGLGLTGTMSINILERTREIGVLRAVGAANAAVLQVVVVEGLVVSLLSWIFGALASVPVAPALAAVVIYAILETRLNFRYSVEGLFLWLAIVLVIGVFSSLTPAYRAARLRVREVLDYE
ncbi:MAG: FtsX-like permease family protein [Chloroflexi bacterium]|nr:FtsX-like permease family protein [Chloroflexota bacterium]